MTKALNTKFLENLIENDFLYNSLEKKKSSLYHYTKSEFFAFDFFILVKELKQLFRIFHFVSRKTAKKQTYSLNFLCKDKQQKAFVEKFWYIKNKIHKINSILDFRKNIRKNSVVKHNLLFCFSTNDIKIEKQVTYNKMNLITIIKNYANLPQDGYGFYNVSNNIDNNKKIFFLLCCFDNILKRRK